MPSHVMGRPRSLQTSSTISHDDIPPQPLDPDPREADPVRRGVSHDHPPSAADDHDQLPSTTTGIDDEYEERGAVAFHKLPDEVIQRILWAVDADIFASLAVLNRAWYRAAQSRELYAHHLSRCPSYALANTVITGPFRKNDLFRLKAKFAAEVRRNLFEAYLRPRQTLINLISVNASSSAALPGAEAFRFSFSPNGQTILALSSSRIYVIDATSDLMVVRHELKTLRRPLAASVTDDGATLAVLSSKHQANVYQLTPEGVQHAQVLLMDNPPRTIALAPEGTVLAAAYEGGVEVFSLAPTALSTDRRAVRSEAVDSLSFSGDGSMLVGSTQTLDEPSAVVITAPFYTENDLPPKEVHSRMWTTQILFPQISSVCSHAELLQGHMEGDASWLFAYDHTLMSYRAVRTDDTRTGVAYFLNPTPSRRFSLPAPSTAPTATACGTLVVAGFGGSGLWIYGVPEKLDVSPDMGSVVERHEQRLQGRGAAPLTSATGHLEPLMAYSPSVSGGSSDEIEDDSLAAKVDWRESLFVKCRQIRGIEGCTAAKWVERGEGRETSFGGKRLVMVAPGGVDQFVEELGDETMPMDGSRVSILDFDYAPSAGADREITIEVGEREAQVLTEQIGDMDVEVAIERRRSVRDRGRGGVKVPLGRSVTTASALQGAQWNQRRANHSPTFSPLDVDAQMDMAESFPRPPMPQSPNLGRSNTAAGFNTARYPPRPPLAAQSDPSHVVYHRSPTQPWPSGGDGWESPPPPYSTNLHGHIPPMSPMSPLQPLQPRPMGNNQGPLGMPLAGIPENGHPNQRHARSAGPGFDHPHMQQNQHPAHFPPQPGQFHPQPVPTILENGTSGQQYGTPRQHVPVTQQTFPPMPATPMPDPHLMPQQVSTTQRSPYPPLAPTVSAESSPRPVSREDRPSPFHPSERTSPSNHMPRSEQNPFDMTPTPDQRSSSGSMTLTGANLQARLNHPVPPTPSSLEQMYQSSTVTAGPAAEEPFRSPAVQPPPVRRDATYAVALPTADQLANLERRVSQTRKPVPSGTATRDFSGGSSGAPHGAPAGAWGAAGVAGSPSFNRAIAVPNGLSRPTSRGGGGGIPHSSSTPNLLQRPSVGRLETIESISSSHGPGEPGGSRSHSVAQAGGWSGGQGGPVFLPPALVGRSSAPVSPGPLQRSKTRRNRRKNKGGDPDDLARGQSVPRDANAPRKRDKGGRCVVM